MIPFLVAGAPSLEASARAIEALAGAGASVIEVGIPFSDPIADGPVISEAMRHALEQGVTPGKVFAMVAEVRPRVDAAIVFMVSVSIVERMGRESFVQGAADAGADGLIVPDMDLDEAPALAAMCRARGLVMPLLVAPATPPQRQRRIADSSSGFIYLLARVGVTGSTGSRATDAEQALARRVAALRSLSPLPIACGFGISDPAEVQAVCRSADAAIVGSALVRAMQAAGSPQAAADAAAALQRALSQR